MISENFLSKFIWAVFGVVISYFIYSNSNWFFPIERYSFSAPNLDCATFFNGNVFGYGMLEAPNGSVLSRYNIGMQGSWVSEQGKVVQTINLIDKNGHEKKDKSNRIDWHGIYYDDHKIYLNSDRTLEKSIFTQYGNSGYLKYILKINNPIFNNITVHSKMYLITPSYMIVQTKIKKFGFVVATGTTTLMKI